MNVYYLALCVSVFALLCPALSCTESSIKTEASEQPHKPAKESFDAMILSSNATKLRAPRNYFSLNGWTSNSSWIKLVKFVEDGKEVKKGDLIGGFKFHGEKALPKVMEKIARTEAEQEKSIVEDSDSRLLMKASKRKSQLRADISSLDLTRGNTVSKRELKRFAMEKELADFDTDANDRFLRAQSIALKAERQYLAKNVELARGDRTRFDLFKKMFNVLAPHDGVVRHARHRWRNRKIQQGDGMPSGMHFASIAKDSAVEIQILIPEKYYHLVNTKKKYLVRSPNGDQKFLVNVESVESFPQTIGFVKQDNQLPNAEEIVYVVHAKFESTPKVFTSGLEVKVELP